MSKQLQFSRLPLLVIVTAIYLLGFSLAGYCQLSVVSIFPADGATNVDSSVTIEISFSAPLDTSARFPMPGDLFLDLLVPPDSLLTPPDSISMSADLKTVQFHNIGLLPDTKYIFGVLAAKGQAGEPLDQPAVVTFTTGATLPTCSVSGTVTFPGGNLKGALVALFEDLFEGDVVSGAVVDPATGGYTISYVQPGSYFPVTVKDISGDGEPDMFNQGDPMGIFDPNGDTIPDSISLSAGQALSGIDMELRLPEAKTAGQNVATAQTIATNLFPDAFLAGIGGQGFQPDGNAILWFYLFISPSAQKGLNVIVTNVLSFWEEQEDPPLDAVALPEGWVDSDVAADTASANGGVDFLNNHLQVEMTAQLYWMDIGGSGASQQNMPARLKKIFKQKLSLPKLHTTGTALTAAWMIDYWDRATDQRLTLFIDALTGELIPVTPPGATTARFNLDAADQAAKTWAADAGLVMVGIHQSELTPDGTAMMWFYIYHSASLDSDQVFIASNGTVVVQGPIWQPPSLTPLPPDWIDSDVAIDTAEAHGGSQYRAVNQDITVDGSVSRGLFDSQPGLAVWQFRYSSSNADPLLIFVDAVTGEFIQPTVGVEIRNDPRIIPENFSLNQNYPNPFNPETTIEYGLPRASNVKIIIFNLQGKKIATVIKSYQPAGLHQVKWDGNDEHGSPVASGVYFYQLKAGDFSSVRKMLLLR